MYDPRSSNFDLQNGVHQIQLDDPLLSGLGNCYAQPLTLGLAREDARLTGKGNLYPISTRAYFFTR